MYSVNFQNKSISYNDGRGIIYVISLKFKNAVKTFLHREQKLHKYSTTIKYNYVATSIHKNNET